MKRWARDKETDHPKPIERIELSEKHFPVRIVMTVVFAVVAVICFAYAITALFSSDSGWKEVSALSSADTNCSEEFVLLYDFTGSSASVSVEYRQIRSLYTEAAVKAYQLFHSSELFTDLKNIAYINQHPNEVIEVDELLYHAFSQLEESGLRNLYLAPIYQVYQNLFFCSDDFETQNYDPYQNEEIRSYFEKICSYANQPTEINLELLGNNQVCLFVSSEYLQIAQSEQIDSFIDFFWLKNAFLVDYFAEVLTENGYTHGTISSFDGFIRTLDTDETDYSMNYFHRTENTVSNLAKVLYSGSRSFVFLRNFQMNNSLDISLYYVLEDGTVRNPYIDTTDGLCKCAVDDLLCYSDTAGCAEILLQLIPVFIADSFDVASLQALKSEKIYFVTCQEASILYNDRNLNIEIQVEDLYEKKYITG